MRKVRRVLGLGRETLARLGDGELRLAGGGSQDHNATETVAADLSRPPKCPLRRTEQTCPVSG